MKEKNTQTKIIKYLENEGYCVIKQILTNKNGIPDLLILIGNGNHFWIEVKEDSKESKLQEYRRKELHKIGDISLVCYGYDDFLKQILKIDLTKNKKTIKF